MVCHTCDNPPCCNPDHLFLGTAKDNSLDAKSKGICPRGESQGNSILTDDMIIDMLTRYGQGESAPSISKDYNMDKLYIYKIINREVWAHVNISEELQIAINNHKKKPDRCYGAKSKTAKLTQEQVDDIPYLHYTLGYSFRKIGRILGVGHNTISDIIHGRAWNEQA